jgi:hypothetical protein
MIRKKNLIFYGTTQLILKIDNRVRDEADYIYRCEKYVYDGKRFIQCGGVVPKELSNAETLIKVSVVETFSKKIVDFTIKANEFYNMYDTNQIIKIEGLQDEYDE